MVAVVTSQILENGPRRAVAKFTGLFASSDDETNVKKVDATATGPYGVSVQGQTFYPGVNLKVIGVKFNINGLTLRMLWEATSNVDMLVLGPANGGDWTFLDERGGFQGIVNPSPAGATGSILFTTLGAAANANYSVVLTMVKGVPQS